MSYDPNALLWCIVKKAPVRQSPNGRSGIIAWLKFGQRVVKQHKPMTNGYVKVEYRTNIGAKKIYFTGWVSVKALTRNEVEDFGLLYFDNTTGMRIPVRNRYYNGDITGFIEPMESVVVLAKAGSVCLTNRGWTRFKWLTKSRYIFDQTVIDSVLYATLSWAVKDYRTAVKRLQKKRYRNMREFCNTVDDIDEIGVFFLEKGNAMNIDKVPGEERFAMLNAELGIDKEWLKEMLCKRDSYRQSRGWKSKV